MKSALSLALILYLAAPSPVCAQERIEPTRQWPVATTITPEAIRVALDRSEARRQFSSNYARTGGSVAKGALIGFGIGAVLGTTVGQEACLHTPRWHCAVGAGAMFAVIGGLIAWLH